MSLKPAEVIARTQRSANQMSGEFGGVCRPCTGPVALQFYYDDPLCTPITDMPVRFLDAQSNVLAETRTYHPMCFGVHDGTEAIPPILKNLGVAEQADLPMLAFGADTGDADDIQSKADEAWALEQRLVGDLWAFEQTMGRLLKPYGDRWQRDGWRTIPREFTSAFGEGLSSWWDGERAFWGSLGGWLKSSVSSLALFLQNNPELRMGVPGIPLYLGRVIADYLFDNSDPIINAITSFTNALRALLLGDVDAFFEHMRVIPGLASMGGVIGEFATLVRDIFAGGAEWLNSLLETIRRTPVLGLISRSAMRVIGLMTPNFWAEVAGSATGFVLPELLMWLITAIIVGLASATGVGAAGGVAALLTRAGNLLRKLQRAVGSARVLGRFTTLLKRAIDQLGSLGNKLRASIREFRENNIVDRTQRFFLRTRYYRRRLDELKIDVHNAHGPQRHEGDVTFKQLGDRTYKGIDPMTGTTMDGIKPGQQHFAPRNSTKFNTPHDFVRADEFIRKTPDFTTGVSSGFDKFRVTVNIDDPKLFGTNAQVRFAGLQRVGSVKNPQGVRELGFNGGKIVAVYKKRPNGTYGLYTMYPEPTMVYPAILPWS